MGIGGAYWAGIGSLVVSAIVAMRMPDLPEHAPSTAATDLAAVRAPATLRFGRRGPRQIFLTVGIGALLVAAVRASRQAVIPLWAESIGLDAADDLAHLRPGRRHRHARLLSGRQGDGRKGRAWVAVPSMLIMGVALLLTPFTHGALDAAARLAR